MSNLTISLTPELERFIESEIASGDFESRGHLVRKALRDLEEERIFERVSRASKEIREGKYYEGDLKDLIKKI